jgi:tRNA nucleotidyltransferase/poly(A) polymerase
MYNSKVEKTTNDAIKQNLNGVKKISKERILMELYKILDLKNFINLNESIDLKEIFNLIFPEFDNLERLDRLLKICNHSQINRVLLLAVLLVDEKNSHEYFGHKYNVSNNIKDNLNLLAKNLKLLKENKDFLNKDLEKNIYLNDKNHLINLSILNFVVDTKYKLDDFSQNLKRILRAKTYKFRIDGKYLKDNGMRQGAIIGKVLKKLEEEWIRNNFKITKNQIQEIIKQYSI